jgi:hypothetical protein
MLRKAFGNVLNSFGILLKAFGVRRMKRWTVIKMDFGAVLYFTRGTTYGSPFPKLRCGGFRGLSEYKKTMYIRLRKIYMTGRPDDFRQIRTNLFFTYERISFSN